MTTCRYINSGQSNFKYAYLGEFETEFKNILGHEWGAQECSFDGKKQRSKNSCYCPFNAPHPRMGHNIHQQKSDNVPVNELLPSPPKPLHSNQRATTSPKKEPPPPQLTNHNIVRLHWLGYWQLSENHLQQYWVLLVKLMELVSFFFIEDDLKHIFKFLTNCGTIWKSQASAEKALI